MPAQTPKKPTKKSTSATTSTSSKPKLLSGGNPQIPKGDGDAPVQAYIKAVPGWKRDIVRRVDDIVVRSVPKVHKALKWISPFYGFEEEGWFLYVHCFDKYVKVTFFQGASLKPAPEGTSKYPAVRSYDIREGELDETQFAKWVKQAAKAPLEHM